MTIDKKARNRAYNAKWREANREKYRQQQAAYRERHREKIRARHAQWVEDNKEANKEHKASYYQRNKEEINSYAKEYAKNNPDWKASRCAHRRAAKLKATPAWANQRYIKLFYTLAKIEARRTGRKVAVDHIVPLNSPVVCGLHCEDNLQLLFAEDNSKKSNKLL